MLYLIVWRGTKFGAFTLRDAEKALMNFYPGGEIIPA